MEIKERPILLKRNEVIAILEGRQTQLRRIVKPKDLEWMDLHQGLRESDNEVCCPYGMTGGKLWGRETTGIDDVTYESVILANYLADGAPVLYSNCNPEYDGSTAHWWYKKDTCPSIHMPRWASRILLEIVSVRVERLNDISEADAKAEGLRYHSLYNEWGGVEGHPASRPDCPQWRWYDNPSEAFKNLWESINGEGSWQTNPWVWVIEFRKI